MSRPRSLYIAGPFYDWFFFILSPLWSLLLGIALSFTSLAHFKIDVDYEPTRRILLNVLLSILIHAHLVAVFLRSHANSSIFRLYPTRFIAIPILLYLSMMVSEEALITITVLIVFWDVYHSSLQTFGIARIYDRNEGNDPSAGRALDIGLNLLMYIGPIIGGATMLDHFQKFELFEDIGWLFFSKIPVFLETWQRYFTYGMLGFGTLFLAYYAWAYRALSKKGYKISLPKVVLLAGTGFCSIYTWGLNSFGQAFLIMNTFHAVQYLALVWHQEGRRLQFSIKQFGFPAVAALLLPLLSALLLGYGYFAELVPESSRALWCIPQTVSILHFWYDGFVWSVRKKQI